MAIQNIAMRAYGAALDSGNKLQNKSSFADTGLGKTKEQDNSFAKTIEDSLKNVNELQSQKADMIEAFASGEKQNVHELMISLQKAGVAMKMTSTVRSKIMEAYKEMTRISF